MNKVLFDNKIIFKKLESHGSNFVLSTNERYALLASFIGEYHSLDHDVPSKIKNLKSVLKGEKTFDEIQDTNMYWSYGNGIGTFECDQETAYCDPDENETDAPALQMPLSEVIYLLKEWQAFMENK